MNRFPLIVGLICAVGCQAPKAPAQWEYLCVPSAELFDAAPLLSAYSENSLSQADYDRQSAAIIEELTRAVNDPDSPEGYYLEVEQRLDDLNAEHSAAFDAMVKELGSYAQGLPSAYSDKLNEFGQSGWELVQIVGSPSSLLYFKRRL